MEIKKFVNQLRIAANEIEAWLEIKNVKNENLILNEKEICLKIIEKNKYWDEHLYLYLVFFLNATNCEIGLNIRTDITRMPNVSLPQ